MPKDIMLKNVRLSYAHLATPVSYVQGEGFVDDPQAGVYSSVLIIPKGSDAEKTLAAAIKEVRAEALASGIRAQGNKTVKVTEKDMLRYNDGVKDGDTKEDEVYADAVYINAKAKSNYKPAVYDQQNNRVENSVLYSGCYVNVYVRVYNYMAASNLGCSYGLTALQFHAAGEPLAKTIDTDSIFGDKKEAAKDDDMYQYKLIQY